MDRKHFGIALALAISPAIAGDDLTYMPSPELCILFGMTLITGEPTYQATQAELVAEITKRSEACAPSDVYMAAATERVRRLDEAKRYARESAQQTAIDEANRREQRRQRIGAFSRALLQTQMPAPQQRPRTVRCNTFAGTTTCTEN